MKTLEDYKDNKHILSADEIQTFDSINHDRKANESMFAKAVTYYRNRETELIAVEKKVWGDICDKMGVTIEERNSGVHCKITQLNNMVVAVVSEVLEEEDN